MASEDWFAGIESTVFTVVEHKLKYKEQAPFPKLFCTTKNENWTESGTANFPSLYLHELAPIERGQDLEGKTVNAVLCTIEIQVYSNKSEQEVRKIMTKAILAMKSLGFEVTMFPDPTTNNKVSSAVARFRRMIGGGDTDIVD